MQRISGIIPEIAKNWTDNKVIKSEECESKCRGGRIIRDGFVECMLYGVAIEKQDCVRYDEILSKQRREEKEFRRPQVCERLRIPRRYQKATLDFKSKACKRMRKFLKGKEKCLVLSGGCGCGKSSAVCAYLIKVEEGLFVDVSEIKTVVFRHDYEFLQQIKDTPILVIDDLGLEAKDTTGFFATVVDEIFNCRYSQEFTTIITTNTTPEEFKERYGERTVDRIREWGEFWSTSQGSFRKVNKGKSK